MEKEWVPPKVIIGKDTTGIYYSKRYDVEQETWKEQKSFWLLVSKKATNSQINFF